MNDVREDKDLRVAAAKGLGRIGDSSSILPLTAIINTPTENLEFKISVAQALATLLKTSKK